MRLLRVIGACGCVLASCQNATPRATITDGGTPAASSQDTDKKPAMYHEPRIPLAEVVKLPAPGTATPVRLAFSPKGDAVTFLWSPDGSLTRALYRYDLSTGDRSVLFEPPEGGATEANLSAEEKLQRERKRERGLGISSYAWAERANRFVVPLRGDLWLQDGPGQPPRKVVDADEQPALNPALSKDGAHLAYVQDDELYVVSATPEDQARPRQITEGARGTGKTHGLPEYIAQEEMDRHRGFWWSNDAHYLAYTEVDETHIPIFRIAHQAKQPPSFEDHRYPFSGEANAKVRLGVIRRDGGPTVWMDLRMDGESGDDVYLARVHWMPDGVLLAELQNRAQSRLDLVRFDPKTGRSTVILSERSDVWINLHHLFEPLETAEPAGGFIWGSERSGYMHLYLYDGSGQLVRPLTQGEWLVDDIAGVDETRGLVYFTGSRDGATERHLYKVALQGGDVTRMTTEPGVHGIAMNEACDHYVDAFSSLDHSPQMNLVRITDQASTSTNIPLAADPRVEQFDLKPPELVSFRNRDGIELHGALYKPEGPGPWPVYVKVYGGPGVQLVKNSWGLTADLVAQYIRQSGILVWELDNRGASGRGLAFEGAIHRHMGATEVRDQVDGVQWLRKQGFVKGDSVAIGGWSYGGYMAALALALAPETFKVAVSGAPVTAWDGYDTHYTERYMGTPQNNVDGYLQSSVLQHASKMKGHLLLVHGLLDENVHFRHTARLVDALIDAGKHYELLLFPDERHSPRGDADRVYMHARIIEFLKRSL